MLIIVIIENIIIIIIICQPLTFEEGAVLSDFEGAVPKIYSLKDSNLKSEMLIFLLIVAISSRQQTASVFVMFELSLQIQYQTARPK